MSPSLPVEIPCGRDTRLHLQSLGFDICASFRSAQVITWRRAVQVCHRLFALARTTAHAGPLADGTAHGARPERLRLVRPRAGRKSRGRIMPPALCAHAGQSTPRARHALQAAELCRRAHRHYGCCELMSRSGDCAGRDGEAAVATRSRRSCCFRLATSRRPRRRRTARWFRRLAPITTSTVLHFFCLPLVLFRAGMRSLVVCSSRVNEIGSPRADTVADSSRQELAAN